MRQRRSRAVIAAAAAATAADLHTAEQEYIEHERHIDGILAASRHHQASMANSAAAMAAVQPTYGMEFNVGVQAPPPVPTTTGDDMMTRCSQTLLRLLRALLWILPTLAVSFVWRYTLATPFAMLWKWRLDVWTRPVRTRVAAARNRMWEYVELKRHGYERDFETTFAAVYRRRREMLTMCGCCWSVLSTLAYVIAWWSSSSLTASTQLAAASMYVREGQPGVLLNVSSLSVDCAEIRSGLFTMSKAAPKIPIASGDTMAAAAAAAAHTYDSTYDGTPDPSLARLMMNAHTALDREQDTMLCVCAPMFGKRRRYVAVRAGNVSVVHMFNPRLDQTDWWLAQNRPAPDYMVVPESQTRMFPDRVNTPIVKNVRSRLIRVEYNTHDVCSRVIIEIANERAYCVQVCLDLLDGVSVYERARRWQQNSGN